MTVKSGSETASVNAPAPVTAVDCTSTSTKYTAKITYSGGSSADKTYESAK